MCCSNSTKAQLASNKSLSEFYSKNTKEKLAESNTNKSQLISSQKKQNLPSQNLLLKDMANSKIKNPGIVQHKNSTPSIEEKKNKLSSNSTHLKQLGHPSVISRQSPS